MGTGQDLWRASLEAYAWDVDLCHFKNADEYPGHFRCIIGSRDVAGFEALFREAVEDRGSYEVAGEVCYWKNFGSHLSRDRITYALLKHLARRENWGMFSERVKGICTSPSFYAFRRLQAATGQPHGFATPLTFVSFYDPASFPMVDKHIAYWWAASKKRFGLAAPPCFSQRDDGWIETTTKAKTEQNWGAYMAWTRFCRDYAQRLGGWRARDVEMAVWMAQQLDKDLPALCD